MGLRPGLRRVRHRHGEYQGVIRVARRAFQSLLNESPTPERCLEAYYRHRIRFERIAERKVRRSIDRRRQCRDHGPRSSRTRVPSTSGADFVRVGCSMSTVLIVHRDAERNFPVRIRIAVPPDGFGSQLDQMIAWVDANFGPDCWSMAPSGTHGIVNDSLAIYFLNGALARAFVNRWCMGAELSPERRLLIPNRGRTTMS